MSACLSMREETYSSAAAVAEPITVLARERTLREMPKRASAENENELIRRLKAADERALEAIFDLYSTRLYNLAQRILCDAGDAQEVIQDVFWTAFRKAESFRGNSQFSTWLYRLTVNAALGKIRRRKAQKQVQYEEYCQNLRQTGITKLAR